MPVGCMTPARRRHFVDIVPEGDIVVAMRRDGLDRQDPIGARLAWSIMEASRRRGGGRVA
jgi:hypothetical protein